MKIDQSTFIKDLVFEKVLTKCNANIILMQTRSTIKILNLENYDKTDPHKY